MSPVVAVLGYGPGISAAVAKKFGGQGYSVALVSRTQSKLDAAAEELKAQGITAKGFAADLADLAALPPLFDAIKAALGPVTVLVWNAYHHILEDPLSQTPEQLLEQYAGPAALVRSIQLAVPQLEGQKGAAIAVTGGGMAFTEVEPIQAWGASINLHIAGSISAVKHSLVATLRHTLRPKGIKVTEVVVTGAVKGTAFDNGTATIDAADIAAAFFKQVTEDTESWYAKV